MAEGGVELWLVRHGQSQGNVARDAADEAGHHEIDIDCVNRFDETIDGQAADQAPRFIPIQYCGDIGEIARTTICDRFKYFRCRHVRSK